MCLTGDLKRTSALALLHKMLYEVFTGETVAWGITHGFTEQCKDLCVLEGTELSFVRKYQNVLRETKHERRGNM